MMSHLRSFFCAWITHIHKVATKIEWWIFFWVHQLPWCRLSLSRWHSTIIISVSRKQITVLGSNHPQEVVHGYGVPRDMGYIMVHIWYLQLDYYHWKLAILMINYASGYTSTTKNPCMKWPKCFLCSERICLISRLAFGHESLICSIRIAVAYSSLVLLYLVKPLIVSHLPSYLNMLFS